MCNCNQAVKNQTAKEYFSFLNQPDKSDSLGIGLFLVPAPEVGIMEHKIVTVEGLTYKEAAKRGQMCEVFKFFPVGITMPINKDKTQSITILTADDLKKTYCAHGQTCDGVNCDEGCVCLVYSYICYAG